MIPIVLASRSPRRRALLNALGIEVDVRVSDVEESAEGPPEALTVRNAVAKREGVARCLEKPALVIAADTVVVLEDRILGKPADLEEATAMLSRLSGKSHRVVTGLAVVNTETGETAEGVEATKVTFRELTPEYIARFVDAVRPLDRAGAYTVDGPGSLLVAQYDGCYHNVLGLPLVCLDRLMHALGDSLFARMRPDGARVL